MSQTINQVTPEGYKQTEVGVIPEDWEVKKLKEISPSQSVGLVINPSSYYSNSGTIPMLVGSHVFENKIKWSKANKITAESNLRLPASRLKTGDLVTVRVGEPGITAVVPPELNQSNCASMMIIRQGPKFDSHWLCFLMNSKIGKSRIEGVQYGTAQKQFNIIDAVDFLFPFPTKEEQTAIANALSDMDALLSELEKLIAKKQAIKTATMQQLLTGKTRLPQFAYYSDINSTEGAVDGKRKGTKPSELGEIPEDWEVKQVKEVCGFIVPGRNKPRSFSGNIPWVTTSDIDSFKSIDMSKVSLYVSREEAIFIGSKVVPKNAVIMSCVGELGIVAVVEDEIVINQQLHAFIPSNAVCSRYLAYTLTSLKEHFYSKATKTTLPYLNKDNCNSTPIALPTKNEQIAIATILSDMDNEIQTLEQRLSKTRQIKQGMMQELLTGKNRLLFENLMSKERYLNGNSVK